MQDDVRAAPAAKVAGNSAKASPPLPPAAPASGDHTASAKEDQTHSVQSLPTKSPPLPGGPRPQTQLPTKSPPAPPGACGTPDARPKLCGKPGGVPAATAATLPVKQPPSHPQPKTQTPEGSRGQTPAGVQPTLHGANASAGAGQATQRIPRVADIARSQPPTNDPQHSHYWFEWVYGERPEDRFYQNLENGILVKQRPPKHDFIYRAPESGVEPPEYPK